MPTPRRCRARLDQFGTREPRQRLERAHQGRHALVMARRALDRHRVALPADAAQMDAARHVAGQGIQQLRGPDSVVQQRIQHAAAPADRGNLLPQPCRLARRHFPLARPLRQCAVLPPRRPRSGDRAHSHRPARRPPATPAAVRHPGRSEPASRARGRARRRARRRPRCRTRCRAGRRASCGARCRIQRGARRRARSAARCHPPTPDSPPPARCPSRRRSGTALNSAARSRL
ncbi:hypothetical protein OJJOAM_002092 [Cupriavidus sp. H18C1]